MVAMVAGEYENIRCPNYLTTIIQVCTYLVHGYNITEGISAFRLVETIIH